MTMTMTDHDTCPICGLDDATRARLEAHARTLGVTLADLIAIAAEALVEAASEKSTDDQKNLVAYCRDSTYTSHHAGSTGSNGASDHEQIGSF